MKTFILSFLLLPMAVLAQVQSFERWSGYTGLTTLDSNHYLCVADSGLCMPTVSGQSGKYLTNNGTTTSWGTITSLSAANPSALIGLSAINGSAATFMRSDAAPALDQSITPTWTASHIFSQAVALTPIDAITLATTSSATSGNQKNAPSILFTSSVYNTDSSKAEAAQWRVAVEPVQGSTFGLSSILKFYSRANDGWATGWTERFGVSSVSGILRINGSSLGAGLASFTTSGGLISNSLSGAGGIIVATSYTAVTSSDDFRWDVTNKTLQVNGGYAAKVITKLGAYTIKGSDSYILCDATAGPFTVVLPAASAITVGATGQTFTIKKIDATGNAVTVSRAGSDSIEGSSTITLGSQYSGVTVFSDGIAIWYKK
jgi:hypothetical protein